jgi:hypothetical protein
MGTKHKHRPGRECRTEEKRFLDGAITRWLSAKLEGGAQVFWFRVPVVSRLQQIKDGRASLEPPVLISLFQLSAGRPCKSRDHR